MEKSKIPNQVQKTPPVSPEDNIILANYWYVVIRTNATVVLKTLAESISLVYLCKLCLYFRLILCQFYDKNIRKQRLWTPPPPPLAVWSHCQIRVIWALKGLNLSFQWQLRLHCWAVASTLFLCQPYSSSVRSFSFPLSKFQYKHTVK